MNIVGSNLPDTLAKQIEGRIYTDRHPMLGSVMGRKAVEASESSIDDPRILYEMEVRRRAEGYIQNWFSPPGLTPLQRALGPLNPSMNIVDRINNQFAAKITPCLLNEDFNASLISFRNIVPNTIDEETILLINDSQFKNLHEGLKEYIAATTQDISDSVAANQVEIEKADRMQFNGNARRSLEQMLASGMAINIDPSYADIIYEAEEMAGEGILPLTEYVKNERVLGVSGFMGAKVSLAVHDFMDHLWTFSLLERSGVLERYGEMFASIGNPQRTDIYKREGEIVASVAFGVRYFQTMPSAFAPRFRTFHMGEHMDDLLIKGELLPRHMEAYRIMKSLRKGSMDWQSLGFGFSNYITELDEQRRKFGRIKQLDLKTNKVIGELDPMSPDFMCFFVDTHTELMKPKNKHRDDLFRFHILLEEYLTSFAKGTVPIDEPLIITPDKMRDLDFMRTTLPPQRIQWMRNNPGFTASRDAII